MHLLFVTFGNNEKNHAQAFFCICSFLAQHAKISSINIVTDQPAWYKSIENRVNLIVTDEQILEEWKGPYNYMWRIKIKAVEKMIFSYPGEPILYLDTDTFLYGDFSAFHELCTEGFALMHEDEGCLSERPEKSMKMMATAFRRQQILNYSNLENYHMWNAGLILIPNTRQGDEIREVLSLCDAMCKQNVRPYFIEQFCFSVVLKNFYDLKPASAYVAHYWSNRAEWNETISTFLIAALLKNLNKEEIIQSFRELQISAVPIKRITKNTNQRLKAWIDRIFPSKATGFAGK